MNKLEINKFLQFWMQAAKENPNFDFNLPENFRYIYQELINIGVKEKKDNKSLFLYWQDYYKDKNNIKVFVSNDSNYFCYFINQKEEINDWLKVYIPLDSEHIKKGALLIFDFLSSRNIIHQSKIGREIRFDDIVVRLTKKEDVDELLNFVRNNKYLQEGLIPSNPFAYQKDNIALACDGRLSYNVTISKYIRLYINEKKKNNELDTISSDDFINFIHSYYQERFNRRERIMRTIKDFNDGGIESLIDLKRISELLIKGYDNTFSYNDYIKHFMISKDSNIKLWEYNQFKNKFNIDIDNILLYAYNIMIKKYGYDKMLLQLELYLQSNDQSYITREGDLRQLFQDNDISNILKARLVSLGMNLPIYLNSILKKEVDDILIEYVETANQKYNDNVGLSIISELLLTKDYYLITRDKRLRYRMEDIDFVNRLSTLLGNNENLYTYYNNLINNSERTTRKNR